MKECWHHTKKSNFKFPFSISDTVFVCVGTDRSTGDALGPMVGTKLIELGFKNVYGTLDEPVHALNLEDTIRVISKKHPQSKIIAVDACLGKSENIGMISLADSPLKPGTGINKVLPSVGDYHLIGIVNVGGLMEYFVLKNTRLSLVVKMCDSIVEFLSKSLVDCADLAV